MFLSGFGEFVSALWRTDAVHLHVRAQGYGHMRSHTAEQCARGGLEDHCHAFAGDRTAAEGNDHEPEGDDQRTHLKVGALRGPERRAGGPQERGWEQEHHGGRVQGPRGHFGTTVTDFTVAKAETRKSGGRRPWLRALEKAEDEERQCASQRE